MIVVITGTGPRFPRLIEGAAECARERPEETFWIQHGHGDLPSGLAGAPFVPRTELLARLAGADVVICHAGSGAIRDALSQGHIPVVLPRLRRFGEIVNDHQLELWSALRHAERIVAISSAAEIGAGIDRCRALGRRAPQGGDHHQLVTALARVLATCTRTTRRHARGRRGLLDLLERTTRRIAPLVLKRIPPERNCGGIS